MKAAIAICVLLALLAGAVWVGHYGWESAGDVVMPPWGWLPLLMVAFPLLIYVPSHWILSRTFPEKAEQA